MRQKSILAVAAMAFAAVVFVVGQRAGGSPGDAGLSRRAVNVAVVDMETVIQDYLRVTGELDRVRAKSATERRALEEVRNLITSMQQEADVHPEDSQQYFDIMMRIAVKKAEYEKRVQFNDLGFNRERAKLMAEAFRKAQAVIETYAREKSLDLVLQIQTADVRNESYEAVSSQIVVRNTLFANEALDITQIIIDRMK